MSSDNISRNEAVGSRIAREGTSNAAGEENEQASA